MPSKSLRLPLTDIVENVDSAWMFVSGFTYEAFRADPRTVYAVTRCLEIISEASRRLPDDVKDRHPHIPWKEIAGAGSVYRHGYHAIRDDTP